MSRRRTAPSRGPAPTRSGASWKRPPRRRRTKTPPRRSTACCRNRSRRRLLLAGYRIRVGEQEGVERLLRHAVPEEFVLAEFLPRLVDFLPRGILLRFL